MPSGGPRLSIDLTSHAVAATVDRSGTRIPILIGARLVLPPGVAIAPDGHLYFGLDATAAQTLPADHLFVSDPVSLLGAQTAQPDTVDAVEVVAGLLRHVAEHATHQIRQPIAALTVTIPTGWGPRRRDLLTDAATRANLPPPTLVTAPAALAAYATTLGLTAPPGSCLLTYHADQHPPTLTVLQAHTDGYHELATHPVDAPHDLDQILADRLTTTDDPPLRSINPPDTDRDDAAVRESVRQARHALTTQDRAPVLLPAPRPPAVITRTDVTAAAQPLLERIPAAVTSVLDAADINRQHLIAVIVCHTGPVPGLVETLTTTAGATAGPVEQPHALADGALALAATHHATTTAADTQLPRVRLRISDLIAVFLLGGSSVAMLLQATYGADIRTIEGRVIFVNTSMSELGAAGAFAVLTAYAVAYLAPTTWLAGPPTANGAPTAGRLIRHAYLAAAASGPVAGILYALAVGTVIEFTYRPFLTWTLGWTLPLAACAAVIALAAPHIPADDLPEWLTRAKPAILHAAIGATGILLMITSMSHMPINSPGVGLVGITGAALIGVATGLTITRIRAVRIIIATGLAIGYALVHTWPNHNAIIIGYLLALTWWAIHLTGHTLRLAFSFRVKATLQRLSGDRNQTSSQERQ
ncbi:hypothetical protein GCM10029963_73600 [Micromonospora andamanensis]|uniref:hypothetical protein n=1 Tax=Micromonospora andamanensis TaxID=1287068 RepID=UPI00194F7508|nr:hypothetical protein [Micromonospora andamanensis]GIJ42698.1 hypothetical protein Vwe01_60230 [Micromonospora andamanensis]